MTNASDRRRRPRRRPHRLKDLPLIFFCGDPHGEFEYINEAVRRFHPKAVVLLGDIQPPGPVNVILKDAMALTEVWWIPGNHDSDTEEFYERLWKGPLAGRNLHGRVADVAGVRIAGLGGVFRGQIWMPEGDPHYRSAASFVRRAGHGNLWHGGLPRRHRTSIFPTVYDNLLRQRADVLITHEAAGCHKKGFEAIDRLGSALHVKWLFHGHQHEDHMYGRYKGMIVRGIGYRGIVDLEGNVVVPSQLDPRDIFALQEAGDEPAPNELDAVLCGAPDPRVGSVRRAPSKVASDAMASEQSPQVMRIRSRAKTAARGRGDAIPKDDAQKDATQERPGAAPVPQKGELAAHIDKTEKTTKPYHVHHRRRRRH